MKLKLVALMLVAGSSLFAKSHWSFSIGVGGYAPAYAPGYYYDAQRADLNNDYRDLAADRAQAARLRADIARDEDRLDRALYYGNRWEANRISADLARDRAALDALERDMAHDRRDIRHDQWETYGPYR
jgi:hypothetical protein